MNRAFHIILVLLCFARLHAQTIDSLKRELNLAANDTMRCLELNAKIAEAYFKENNWSEAVSYGEKAYGLRKKMTQPEDLRDLSGALWRSYKELGNYEKAIGKYKAFIRMRDSVNSMEARKASVRSQLRFKYEKKAAQDSIRVAEEKEVFAAQYKTEQTRQYVLYGGLALVGLFAIFMLNRFLVINAQRKQIAEKKKEADEQKRTVELQKAVAEEKQREIMGSLMYARRIQRALIASESYIDRTLRTLTKDN